MTTPATTPAKLIPDDLSSLKLTPPGWDWRPGQQELAERIASSTKKIVMLEAECGTGKSIIPTAAAMALHKDAVVLIQTIQLQEQYLRDLKGLVTMTGRAHDVCNLNPLITAADAPCTVGAKCSLKGTWARNGRPLTIPACHYFRRKANAALSQISIQNYAYWLGETSNEGSVFNKRDWIICDEGHELDQILMQAAIVEFREADLKLVKVSTKNFTTYTMEDIRKWSRQVHAKVLDYKDSLRSIATNLGIPVNQDSGTIDLSAEIQGVDTKALSALVRGLQVARRLESATSTIMALKDDQLAEWVWCPPDRSNKEWTARPIYGKYGFKRILDAAADKVIIMSAYLAPELLIQNLGLDPEEVDVIIAPKVFNRVRSPILYCPTVKVKYGMSRNQLDFLYAVMDELVQHHKDTKGLLHVPSVSMRDELLLRTRNRGRIIAYDGTAANTWGTAKHQSKDDAIATFTQASKPMILLGQSISTGLDLPSIPQWQIVMKLSFPPTNDPVIAARMTADKNFYRYHTICQIVQAAGRVKRSQEHNGPTIILDAQWSWFYAANRKYFPRWFNDSYRANGWDYFPKIKADLSKIAFRNGVIL